MNGDFTMNITEGNCNEACLRCYQENTDSNCYECNPG